MDKNEQVEEGMKLGSKWGEIYAIISYIGL